MNKSEFGERTLKIRKHYRIKWFSENLLAMEMNKTKIKINKPIYLGLPIIEIGKIKMYDFYYGFIKPKYRGKANLCYLDTNSFIENIKTEDVYRNFVNDAEKRFDTSNYETEKTNTNREKEKVDWITEG